jgi:hypothetical protein
VKAKPTLTAKLTSINTITKSKPKPMKGTAMKPCLNLHSIAPLTLAARLLLNAARNREFDLVAQFQVRKLCKSIDRIP